MSPYLHLHSSQTSGLCRSDPAVSGSIDGEHTPARPQGVSSTDLGLDAVEVPVLDVPVLDVRRARSEQAKRNVDVVLAALALVVLGPLLVLIAFALAITTGGNPIFVQDRVGRDAKTFRCLKFRTMRSLSPDAFEALLASDDALRAEWQRDQKLRRDPRVTRFGRLLRSSNLDELPQLLNILAGHMSLVGPRPIVVDEVRRYGHARAAVFSVRPGLTGLWQVSGRNALPYQRRVELDLEYVHTRTGFGDLVIMLRTAGQTAQAIAGRDTHGAF